MRNFCVQDFFSIQTAQWSLLKQNTTALSEVLHRGLRVEGQKFLLQYNPGRIRSTGTSVNPRDIAARPCFLCPAQRPSEQLAYSWKNFEILANPYPILPYHLTIASQMHCPQRIRDVVADFLDLTMYLDGFTVFYNGPRSGASAPDHLHFQSGLADHLPFWEDQAVAGQEGVTPESSPQRRMRLLCDGVRKYVKLKGTFGEVYSVLSALFLTPDRACLPSVSEEQEDEPEWNWIARSRRGELEVAVFPRRAHRPSCYFREDSGKRLISPGALDMGGLIILPRKEDFDELTPDEIALVFREVSLTGEAWDEFRNGLL